MSNINIANFLHGEQKATLYRDLMQYDYGQILRIQGLDMPTAVEIHFSLELTGGVAERRVGTRNGDVTDVWIPDFILQGNEAITNYKAYAFIYPSDGESGETTHIIEMRIKARSKPEGNTSEGNSAFAEIVDAVKKIAEQNSGEVSDEKIQEAVNTYLAANPLEETDPTVSDWAKRPEKPVYSADEVGADASGTAQSKVSEHNVSSEAHNDIRVLIDDLLNKVTTLLDSDDETLDQTSEMVAYIKSNKNLIDAITTSKANVADIVDNLTTNLSNRPLSAAQGVVLKGLIDEIRTELNKIAIPTKMSDLKNDLDYISAPAMAEVGQPLIVEEVDENGKPMKFKTGEVAGGEVIDVDAELKSYYTTVKEDMANAITEKGGIAAATEDFATFPDKIRSLPTEVSPTETLPKQTILRVTPNYTDLSITLNWQNVDAAGYLVKRKVGGIPQSTADGTTVYNGVFPTEEVIDSGLSTGIFYGYRIFPYNSKTQYQARYDNSVVLIELKDRTGQKQLRELAVDDVICFGSYNDSTLLWKVKNTYDKDLGMIGVAIETNIGNKQFDAPENDSENPNPIANRKNNGNNRMLYSNLFQWANSEAEAGAWFQKQHDYDAAPSYSSEAGFLNGFTNFEKNTALIDTKLTRFLDANDGGGTETFYGKMFMPSEALLGNSNTVEESRAWEAFSDRTSTSRAWVANYWAGTIQDDATGSTAASVRYVNSSGFVSYNAANVSYIAVRLFCQLNASAFVAYSDALGGYYFVDDAERNS